MSVEVFDSADEPFFQWMEKHPEGFVVNTERRPNSRLTFLHRSGCFHISSLAEGHRPNAFTKYDYIKVCSLQKLTLKEWAREVVGGELQSCQICKP